MRTNFFYSAEDAILRKCGTLFCHSPLKYGLIFDSRKVENRQILGNFSHSFPRNFRENTSEFWNIPCWIAGAYRIHGSNKNPHITYLTSKKLKPLHQLLSFGSCCVFTSSCGTGNGVFTLDQKVSNFSSFKR